MSCLLARALAQELGLIGISAFLLCYMVFALRGMRIALVAEDGTAPYQATWTASDFPEGPHTLKAIAYDTAAQTGEHVVQLTLDRTPPEVIWDAPPTPAAGGGSTLFCGR